MKKRKKLAQASQNSAVYHEASTFGAEALMSKNNNSLSIPKSDTQVVQDWLKCHQVQTTFLFLKDRTDLPLTLWCEGSEVNELLTGI